MNKLEIKEQLLNSLLLEIDNRIKNESYAIENARNMANSETKCTVGDKYETQRAMYHLEQERYRKQLDSTIHLRKIANTIDVSSIYDNVQLGSVVETSLGLFFIALGGDDIEIGEDEYTPISLVSPIGEAMKGAFSKDKLPFRDRIIEIYSIY